MNNDLTKGKITAKLLIFALPIMAGNILQQFYNIVDTLIVGRALGAEALAAVGASYTLMTFLTSIILGLCMGAGAYFSIEFGRKNFLELRKGIFISFVFIAAVCLVINILVFAASDEIISLLRVPYELREMMKEYLLCVFTGIIASFLYNFYANLLRAVGNSSAPLIFLGISTVLNIALDLLFVLVFSFGIVGAAVATVISQYISAIGLALYSRKFTEIIPKREDFHWDRGIFKNIFHLSFLTCLQQSVMNFGILMVQGLVNSFGSVIMAGFAAAVKIDTVAYMPVQDFGNAFSTFTAQNNGAGETERIKKGIKSSLICVFVFCSLISVLICVFAEGLMGIFIDSANRAVIEAGVQYLRIEAVFYFGIGLLFMLYGFYRAMEKPLMSLILTIFSLGTRVMLAYILSAIPQIGVNGIWISIPIGWFLADAVGVIYYIRKRKTLCQKL